MKRLNENQRRIVMFVVIVAAGSVLVLFDIPLTLMIPLIIVTGVVILFVLGSITIADIRAAPGALRPENIKKISVIKRLDGMKFFEKAPSAPAAVAKAGKKTPPPARPVAAKDADKNPGLGGHLRTFASSLGSLGSVLRERDRHGKKVEEINKLLDRTVSERVSSSPLSSAGDIAKPAPPPAGGPGGAGAEAAAEADPFLSLSGDEFDAGLLDGLDDQDTPAPAGGGAGPAPAPAPEGRGSMVGEPGIPMPPMDFPTEADGILKENAAPGLEEFSALDGGDTIDQDFGELDSLNLDDVNLEEDGAGSTAAAVTDIAAAPAEPPAPGTDLAAPANPAVREIKTSDWIQSDAPGGAPDEVSTHADMAAFAGGPSSDEDLLSSIASDVKHTKKERDLSLLRELKDFKAPAGEIEQELSGLYDRISTLPRKEKETEPRPGK